MTTIPYTSTVNNHGLTISTKGNAVGAITQWGVSQTRTATPVFEFGAITTGAGEDIQAAEGEPYEIVPGNLGGTDINIGRYDIFTDLFEDAFGTDALESLCFQRSSIRFLEHFATPDGVLDIRRVYYGSWFTSIGRRQDAKGDRISMVDARATYARSRKAPV